MVPTRGERNNNPCNLRDFGIAWDGLDEAPHDDDGYCRFASALAGIRAGARDLHSKWARGLNTVRAIISVFAPPSENATGAYIGDVAQRLGIGPDDPVDLADAETLQAFVTAVIFHENGRCIYATTLIRAATAAALTPSA
ncbi:MAG TPA: structural protein [Stellaceae bacterium]|nr:structural protein [Stellaceae bacterium]